MTLIYSIVVQYHSAVDDWLSVEKDEACDASALLELDGEFMGDDAPVRPAEKIVGPVRINSLDPVGIVLSHIPNRLRFRFGGLLNLLNSYDWAVQVIAENLIWPTHPTGRMNAEERNTGTLLQSLNRNHFFRKSSAGLQPLTQTSHCGRFKHGGYRNVGIQAGVDRGDQAHRRN